MVDKVELLYKMGKCGIDKKQLIKELNIHPSTFNKKLNGKSNFCVNEVQIIVQVLHLDSNEVLKIFNLCV